MPLIELHYHVIYVSLIALLIIIYRSETRHYTVRSVMVATCKLSNGCFFDGQILDV